MNAAINRRCEDLFSDGGETGAVTDSSAAPDRQPPDVTNRTVVKVRAVNSKSRLAACLIGGTGLVLVVAGSFLPWVISGNVRRSSYAILGVVDRLGIAGDGFLGILVAQWPLAGALCVLPLVTAALRWWRVTGILSVLIGLAAGVLSLGILTMATGVAALSVRLDPIGPAVMAAGAILLFSGGLALALGAGSPVRSQMS